MNEPQIPKELQQPVQDALSVYVARSARELTTLLDRSYDDYATFQDAIMYATPTYDAIALQFYSLQRGFQDITIDLVKIVSVKPYGHKTRVELESTQRYVLAYPWLLQYLPKVLSLKALTTLDINKSNNKITLHKDDWLTTPVLIFQSLPVKFPYIPLWLREINAKTVNSGFRLLGWHKIIESSRKKKA